ncbi:MAG: diguanylate cyclase [Pseudomonadota bacterium]
MNNVVQMPVRREELTGMVGKILVVDDDAAIRGVVSEVLLDDGHEVVTAASAEEALELFTKDSFALVMSDIRMAGMNGIQLLEQVSELKTGAQFVIMTSHASIETAIQALKLGAYDYLIKPFESLDLISNTANRALESLMLARERDLLVASLTRNNAELERLNRFFRELAIRDGLTGLYNHRYFHEALSGEVDRARRYERELSVLFIDVDYFKAYNDTHGHQRGDELLKELAELLQASVRETDVVARWGGEEFVIMTPETGASEAASMAETLREKVARHPFSERESQPAKCITVSIGVATLVAGGTDQTLVFRADKAVYAAKAKGRNAVCIAA